MIIRVHTSNPNDGSELAVAYYAQKGLMVLESRLPRKNGPIELSLPGSQIGVIKNLLVLRETGLSRVDMTFTWAVVHWSGDSIEDLRNKFDVVLDKWKNWESEE